LKLSICVKRSRPIVGLDSASFFADLFKVKSENRIVRGLDVLLTLRMQQRPLLPGLQGVHSSKKQSAPSCAARLRLAAAS